MNYNVKLSVSSLYERNVQRHSHGQRKVVSSEATPSFLLSRSLASAHRERWEHYNAVVLILGTLSEPRESLCPSHASGNGLSLLPYSEPM